VLVTQSSNIGFSQRVLLILLVIILLLAVWTIRGVLLLAFASIILVVLLTMPVRFLARWGIKRNPAIVLSLVGIVLILFILAQLVFPTLLEQFVTLATVNIPEGIQLLIDQWNSGEIQEQIPVLEQLQPYIENFRIDDINTVAEQLASAFGRVSQSVIPVVGGVAETILSILIVIFLSGYFLADAQAYEDGAVKLFPINYRHRVREIMERIDWSLRRWLEATLLSMIFTALLTWLGLSILGLHQAVALGVLAGVLSFIPNFGQIVALVPAIAVGVVEAPQNLGWIILVIYGVSFLQNQIVGPLLFSETIKVPPVLILLGQIIFGVFFGFMGLMLAVPITAITIILFQEVYVKDFLGDRAVLEGRSAEEGELLPDGT
jgi:predicted PurR-regulated permease PerM